MNTLAVAGIGAVGLGVGYLILSRSSAAAPTTPTPITPPAKPGGGGVVNTIAALSTAGCQAGSSYIGVPSSISGTVCKYTPINVALKYGPAVAKPVAATAVKVATAVAKAPGAVAGGTKTAAKAVFHALTPW